MPGKRITDHQVHKYKQHRNKFSQVAAAAKAGISERSARRIEDAPSLPSQRPARNWRTRADPLSAVWDAEVVPGGISAQIQGHAPQGVREQNYTFNEWSAQAGNYDERAARDTWHSFKPGKGVGPGTLFKMAAENGWRMGTDKPTRPAPVKTTTRHAEPPRKPAPGMGADEVYSRCEAATNAHPYIEAKRAAGAPLNALRVVPAGDALTIQGERMAGALVVPVMRADGIMTDQQKPKTALANFRRQNPRIDYYPTPDAIAAIERLRQRYPTACTRELIDTLVVKGCNAWFPERAGTSQ